MKFCRLGEIVEVTKLSKMKKQEARETAQDEIIPETTPTVVEMGGGESDGGYIVESNPEPTTAVAPTPTKPLQLPLQIQTHQMEAHLQSLVPWI